MTKQYPVVGLCFCIATAANSSPPEFNLVSLDSPASEFITPGRMLSSYSTTPNSVTQLDTQDLMLLGIYELPDAMRLVPGMIQSKLHDSYTTIAYHGTNVSPMTTTGLFFNSTSIYQPQSGGSIGNRTPVDIQDVSTIEVIRGSSAVDYGVNSISSTINLIQNPVALSPDFRIFQQFGSGDTSKTWGEVNQSESSNFFRMRVFKEKDNGYEVGEGIDDFENERSRAGVLLSLVSDTNDGLRVSGTLFGSDYDNQYPDQDAVVPDAGLINNTGVFRSDETQFLGGILRADGRSSVFGKPSEFNTFVSIQSYEEDKTIDLCAPALFFDPLVVTLDASPNITLDPADVPLVIGSSIATGFAALSHSIVSPLTAEDQALQFQLGQKIQALGVGPVTAEVCGQAPIEKQETNHAFEFNSLTEMNSRTSVSSSISYLNTSLRSNTYVQSEAHRDTASLSSNLRHMIRRDLTLNLGGRITWDDEIDEALLSYRAVLNYEPYAGHVVRVLGSEASSSPSISDAEREWFYVVKYDEGVTDYNGQTEARSLRTARSPSDLEPEEVSSFEVGYTYHGLNDPFLFDAKVFYEDYRNLISGPTDYFTWDPNNEASAINTGFEMGGMYLLASGSKVNLTYMYLDTQTDHEAERSMYARHSGHISYIHRLNHSNYVGLGYYGSTLEGAANYSRYDLTYTHLTIIGTSPAKFQLNYRRYPGYIESFTVFNIEEPVRYGYENEDRIFLSAEVEF